MRRFDGKRRQHRKIAIFVNLLYQEIARIVAQPETQKEFERLGFAPVASNPDDSFARVKRELATWAKVVRDAKLQQN